MAGRSDDQHVVGQDDREGLVADQLLGHQDGVAEAELLLLADVGDLGQVADVTDAPEHLDVAALLEQVLELEREIEVVLDRPLLAAGDDDDLLDAGGDRLFDGVLDDRLVDERQHLLRLSLRRRQEPGAPSGGRKDGFADSHRTSGAALVDPRSIPRGPPPTRWEEVVEPSPMVAGPGPPGHRLGRDGLALDGPVGRAGPLALEQERRDEHARAADELDRPQRLGQQDGSQDGPHDRFDQHQDAGADAADPADPDQEQRGRDAGPEDAGDDEVGPARTDRRRAGRACSACPVRTANARNRGSRRRGRRTTPRRSAGPSSRAG